MRNKIGLEWRNFVSQHAGELTAMALIGGIYTGIIADAIYSPYVKRAEARDIRPQITTIERVEQQLGSIDRNRYLLDEQESVVQQRENLQRQYDSFMEDSANREVYTLYKQPERFAPRSSRFFRNTSKALFGLGGLSLLALGGVASKKKE